MRRTSTALVLVALIALAIVSIAQDPKPAPASMRGHWQQMIGARGAFLPTHGGYTFRVAGNGSSIITAVGDDYVEISEFAAPGKKVMRELIPMNQLMLRITP
jgi:hypothetical protein